MPLRYKIAKLTFLESSAKAQGQSLKLSCSWTRNVWSLAGSVPPKGSGSQTFEREPSPWFWMVLANVAIAWARLFQIPVSELLGFLSPWSEWSGFLFESSDPSLSGSSGLLGSPSPGPPSLNSSSLGILFKEPWGSSLGVLLDLLLLFFGAVHRGMCVLNAMPGFVLAFLEFLVLWPVVLRVVRVVVRVVIWGSWECEFKYTVKNVYFYEFLLYLVQLELLKCRSSRLGTRRSRKTMWLQLMCCALLNFCHLNLRGVGLEDLRGMRETKASREI